MMNRLGKGLVLLQLAMSLLFLAMALAIFFQAMDWGWKEASKDLTYRIASEFDKRSAAVSNAQRVLAAITPSVTTAQANLTEIEPFLGDNHLWYRKKLKELRSERNDIAVKEIKVGSNGTVVVDGPKGKRLSKPVLDEAAADITKSFDSYVGVLKDLQKEIDAADADIRKLVEQEKELTLQLIGVREMDKVVKMGLYALLEKEADAQAQIRFEKEYLDRLWANVQQDQDLYIGRQHQLQMTLARMKKLRGAK